MAPLILCTAFVIVLLLLLIKSSFPAAMAADAASHPTTFHCPRPFNPFLAFGDSTTDTGNAIRSATADLFTAATRLPYGETFFKKPTGRFSDGRLIVDDLALALKLPLLPPHLAFPTLTSGASENYAVAGATALNAALVQSLTGVTPYTSDSLGVQLGWFETDTTGVNLSNALIYFGEIGGNDYSYALAGNKTPAEIIHVIVPLVIKKVADSLEEILSSGAGNVVVQGQFPLGCIAVYLYEFATLPHDKHGCIEAVSAISDAHDRLLREVVATASTDHPYANIVLFNTTAAFLHILDYAAIYGFTNVRGACYPGGLGFLPSPYGCNNCSCPNPHNYISWDGIHFTDAMHATLMKLFLTNFHFASPFPNFITSAMIC